MKKNKAKKPTVTETTEELEQPATEGSDEGKLDDEDTGPADLPEDEPAGADVQAPTGELEQPAEEPAAEEPPAAAPVNEGVTRFDEELARAAAAPSIAQASADAEEKQRTRAADMATLGHASDE